ncbi:hypothetical protein SAMN02745126_02373 [Enhydrobacter aerosaccus]|uniref:DUF2946 domain-containing protein n=1 Tax=Enhydrobacter aerosaccus TaxID=225324 RepID=A0A1T4NP70_9HYPH|nr:DUF2946 family protein [Enhydrobacter aerosaccus]SJZ80836.1 hypothetical protein SAMN02745126_02373 [Enhydrobacter aerosaccus]
MDRRRSDRGWRASAIVAALLAITLNFLQPLVHAALARDGGSLAASVWASICLPAHDEGSSPTSMPEGTPHECCLGLAHAPALVAPNPGFIPFEPIAVAIRFAPGVNALTPVGIRDGPNQPRAPPTLPV